VIERSEATTDSGTLAVGPAKEIL